MSRQTLRAWLARRESPGPRGDWWIGCMGRCRVRIGWRWQMEVVGAHLHHQAMTGPTQPGQSASPTRRAKLARTHYTAIKSHERCWGTTWIKNTLEIFHSRQRRHSALGLRPADIRGGSHSTHSELLGAALPSFRYSSHLCCFGPAHQAALLAPRRKEGIRMPSPRWLAILTIPMMAGAALVGSAAIATANPADDAYLAQLRAVGLTWPPNADEALIGEAHLICYDLTWGWTPQQIADDIHAHLDARGVTLLDVGTMVNAAHSTYCPGNVCDAPSLCT